MVWLGDDSSPDDSDVTLGPQGRNILELRFRQLDPSFWGGDCKNIDHRSEWYFRQADGRNRLLNVNVLKTTDWTEGKRARMYALVPRTHSVMFRTRCSREHHLSCWNGYRWMSLSVLFSSFSRMADSELITVGNYVRLPEAELAQSVLDDGGIESVIIDDNMGRMLGWNVVGGFKLQVNKEDADVALQLLSVGEPGSPEKSTIQTRCPSCDSSDITLQDSDSPIGYSGNSLLTPIVIHLHEKSWECKSCGYCWDSSEGK